jgi:formylglycine-generating enzyme required for sulfatase activity
MPDRRHLRVVVSSPDELQAERHVLTTVIDELNRGICQERGLWLELRRWETDAYPGFHPQGPQGLIDTVLRIEACDVCIVLFWKRFGTPVYDAPSGTVHEFRRAYDAWQQHRRPQIMVYFNKRLSSPKTSDEAEQWRRVLEFREQFPQAGVWWPYQGKTDFANKVRQHLTRFLQHEVLGTVPPGLPGHDDGSGGSPQGPGATTAPSPEARRRYLECLHMQCQALPLAALGGEPGTEQDLTLDQVYIALNTTTQVARRAARQRRERLSELDDTRPLSALQAVVQCPRLVLLGDPGAGKSTVVRQVLARLAARQLGLGKVTVPRGLPADLLPLFLPLRDLVPRLLALAVDALPDAERQHLLARAVRDQLVANLERLEAEAFSAELQEALSAGRCLLGLDGLDEVPSDSHPRVHSAVMALLGAYRVQRVIITCRVRSYVGDARLPEFQAHTLAPFDDKQIATFVGAWYTAQKQLGKVDARQATERADNLAAAARQRELRELAANPMLLTTMAIIHQRRVGLPKERVRLYTEAVQILLQRWDHTRFGDTGLAVDLHPALPAMLTDDKRLRTIVQTLAYETHRREQRGQAGLPRGEALTRLEAADLLENVGLAAAFLDYVDHRAGLLVGQGGELPQSMTYNFPHRTFQEYLAGCYLVAQRSMGCELRAHAAEGDFWGLAAQLGAEELFYNLRRDNEFLDLIYALGTEADPTTPAAQRAVLWAGTMATLVGPESIVRDTGGGGAPFLKRLHTSLVQVMRSELPALERAEAGKALAHLGDPGFRQEAWWLPAEPLLGFVEIPAGPFVMGSDRQHDPDAFAYEEPQHEVSLPVYYIARYPTTVAQFQAFVQASGYRPGNAASLRDLANYPVWYVSWHEAMAYCDWLTEQLRRWPGTPEPLATRLRQQGWRVLLPSEAEWEKAARSTDGRRYPWGNVSDSNRANYGDTHIGMTSTVGCFPGGASPYGVEEMSGNVLEWTRSLWQESGYPYPSDEAGRAQRVMLHTAQDASRVLRGGAFCYDDQGVRCAYRGGGVARDVLGDIGCRVVLAGPL